MVDRRDLEENKQRFLVELIKDYIMFAQLDKRYLKINTFAAVRRLVSYALFEGRPIATRGRWINPIVFAHFSLEKRLPQLKRVVKPIFIIGTGRSGSTILGVVLSIHRDIGFLNEPKALWHTIYPEEDVTGSYSRDHAKYRLDERDVSEEVKITAKRLFGAYMTFTLSKRVVDKNPELIFRVPFVREIFPDAKFVFLVRNGWDTCHSIKIWSKRNGIRFNGEVYDWWGVNNRKWKLMLGQLLNSDPAFSGIVDVVSAFSVHTDMAAVEWVVTMREGLKQMEKNPDCIYMVRYEDLTRNPRDVLSKLLAFCDLKYDERLFGYAEQILTPARSHPNSEVNSAIRPLFDETLRSLGY